MSVLREAKQWEHGIPIPLRLVRPITGSAVFLRRRDGLNERVFSVTGAALRPHADSLYKKFFPSLSPVGSRGDLGTFIAPGRAGFNLP